MVFGNRLASIQVCKAGIREAIEEMRLLLSDLAIENFIKTIYSRGGQLDYFFAIMNGISSGL